MKRRELITLLGGAAAVAARGALPSNALECGILACSNLAADDRRSQAATRRLLQGLQQLGWTDGRNVRIDYRWAAGDADRFRRYAAELVALAPDIILAATSPAVVALQPFSRTLPVVFVSVIDPVGAGFVASLARPGGNVTGFTLFEYGIAGKWLELLKEIAPRVTRVAVLRDPAIGAESANWAPYRQWRRRSRSS